MIFDLIRSSAAKKRDAFGLFSQVAESVTLVLILILIYYYKLVNLHLGTHPRLVPSIL